MVLLPSSLLFPTSSSTTLMTTLHSRSFSTDTVISPPPPTEHDAPSPSSWFLPTRVVDALRHDDAINSFHRTIILPNQCVPKGFQLVDASHHHADEFKLGQESGASSGSWNVSNDHNATPIRQPRSHAQYLECISAARLKCEEQGLQLAFIYTTLTASGSILNDGPQICIRKQTGEEGVFMTFMSPVSYGYWNTGFEFSLSKDFVGLEQLVERQVPGGRAPLNDEKLTACIAYAIEPMILESVRGNERLWRVPRLYFESMSSYLESRGGFSLRKDRIITCIMLNSLCSEENKDTPKLQVYRKRFDKERQRDDEAHKTTKSMRQTKEDNSILNTALSEPITSLEPDYSRPRVRRRAGSSSVSRPSDSRRRSTRSSLSTPGLGF